MEETVDAYFDDRKDPDSKISFNGPPPLSIVQVHRFPPDPNEIRNIIRYGSLMPESTARPRKRQLTNPAHTVCNGPRAAASIEGRDDELANRTSVAPNKRRRIQEERTTEVSSLRRPNPLEGNHERNVASQMSGTQGSIHQVSDSQSSPAKKGMSQT